MVKNYFDRLKRVSPREAGELSTGTQEQNSKGSDKASKSFLKKKKKNGEGLFNGLGLKWRESEMGFLSLTEWEGKSTKLEPKFYPAKDQDDS